MSNFEPDYAGVDCTQLEKYLKGGLWRMADHETRKLVYLACGQNPADAQGPPTWALLPCEEIQRLDRLWVKYSRGRFGFSVQRSLYQPLVKRYYEKTDAWNAFGSKVGWRVIHLLKQNYWKKHGELQFAIDAPAGHLPHLGDKFGILTLDALMGHFDRCGF